MTVLWVIYYPLNTDERKRRLPNIVELSVGFELGFECMSAWLQVTNYDESGPGSGVFITIINLILTIILKYWSKEARLHSLSIQKLRIDPLSYKQENGFRGLSKFTEKAVESASTPRATELQSQWAFRGITEIPSSPLEFRDFKVRPQNAAELWLESSLFPKLSMRAAESCRVMFITVVCGKIQFIPQPVWPVSGCRSTDSLRIQPRTCTRGPLLSCDWQVTRRGLPPICGAAQAEAARAFVYKKTHVCWALGDFLMHFTSFNSYNHSAKHMFCPLTDQGKAYWVTLLLICSPITPWELCAMHWIKSGCCVHRERA